MIVKMLKHGHGSTKNAIAYVLSEKDHLGQNRATVEVLRGTPELTASVGDSLNFSSRYNSCVLSFSQEENPSDEQLESILDDFEKVSFVGVNPSWTAVKHVEKSGAIHLHIISAKVDLDTGKAYNPAPPGWEKKFGVFKELQVTKFSNLIEPGTKPKLREFVRYDPSLRDKEALYSHLEQASIAGVYNNRNELLEYLQNFGEVTRNGKDYIGFKPNGSDKAIRIKGEIINGITGITERTREIKQEERARNQAGSEQILGQCAERFNAEVTKLKLYNEARYRKSSGELQKSKELVVIDNNLISSDWDKLSINEQPFEFKNNTEEPRVDKNNSTAKEFISAGSKHIKNRRALFDTQREYSQSRARKWENYLLFTSEIDRFIKMTEVERFKQELSLVDFITALGGQVDKIKSSSSSSLINFENKKFVVSKDNNNYVFFEVNNPKNSGSIVDFYKNNVRNLNFGLIVAELRKFLKGYIPEIKLDNQGLDKTLDYNNFRPMSEAELSKISNVRGISLVTLQKVDIEVDKFGNTCFLNFGYDEKESKFLPCGYEQKLKDGGKRNIGEKGLWLTGQGINNMLYLFESAFDALAYKELKGDEGLYCSVGGAISEKQLKDLKILIKEHKLEVVVLGFDNDEAGKKISSRVISSLEDLNLKFETDKPQNKDWNDDLLREKEKPQIKTADRTVTRKVDNGLSM